MPELYVLRHFVHLKKKVKAQNSQISSATRLDEMPQNPIEVRFEIISSSSVSPDPSSSIEFSGAESRNSYEDS